MNKNYCYYKIELSDGKTENINADKIKNFVLKASKGIDNINIDLILEDTLKNIFTGITIKELQELLIISVKSLIEEEPNYSFLAAKLLINKLDFEICNFFDITNKNRSKKDLYKKLFIESIHFGIKKKIIE